jgi:hypothetical protein
MIDLDMSQQLELLEMLCPHCQVWNSCGGAKAAPCGCSRIGKSRYDCMNCTLLCRDRYIAFENGSVDSFSRHVNSTKGLKELKIKQNFSVEDPFPVLIPLQTRQLPANAKLDWAGVALEDILTIRKKPPISLKKYLLSPLTSRDFLRINENGNLIAVMNGNDEILEYFWASNREEIYEALKANGFLAATGPTFSVYGDDPDSHSVLMLRRQFTVLQELYDRNINPIPNIYFRKGNERDRDEWVEFLCNNPSVYVIYRDFSSTPKNGIEYENLMKYFIEIITRSDRRLHILLGGIGHAKINQVIELFSDTDCTYSFLALDPVCQARIGGKALLSTDNGKLKAVKQPNIPFSALALRNVNTATDHVIKVASSFR